VADANYPTPGNITAATLADNVFHTLLAAPTSPFRIVVVYNTTDKELIYSWDASTTHGYIPAGGTLTLDYGSAQLVESSALSIKHAVDATTGNVVGNAVTA
jgi:hypothetical protein